MVQQRFARVAQQDSCCTRIELAGLVLVQTDYSKAEVTVMTAIRIVPSAPARLPTVWNAVRRTTDPQLLLSVSATLVLQDTSLST